MLQASHCVALQYGYASSPVQVADARADSNGHTAYGLFQVVFN